jgi:hypothetical protein
MEANPMCKADRCSRPVFANGLCGLHALQGYYRTEVVRGVGLAAVHTGRARVQVVQPAAEGPHSPPPTSSNG